MTTVASFLESRFRVIAPDLWGFGLTESWTGEERLTHDHQAFLVAAVIEQVASEPVHLCRALVRRGDGPSPRTPSEDLVKTMILIEPILTPLLKLAGDEEAFREYADMAEAFLSNAATGRLDEAWHGAWEALPTATKERFLAGTDIPWQGFIRT